MSRAREPVLGQSRARRELPWQGSCVASASASRLAPATNATTALSTCVSGGARTQRHAGVRTSLSRPSWLLTGISTARLCLARCHTHACVGHPILATYACRGRSILSLNVKGYCMTEAAECVSSVLLPQQPCTQTSQSLRMEQKLWQARSYARDGPTAHGVHGRWEYNTRAVPRWGAHCGVHVWPRSTCCARENAHLHPQQQQGSTPGCALLHEQAPPLRSRPAGAASSRPSHSSEPQ